MSISKQNSDSDSFQAPFVYYETPDDPLEISASETRPKYIKQHTWTHKSVSENLSITTESVICIECANCLQVFANFKPAGAYMRDDGTLPLADVKNEYDLDPVRCRFCAKTNGTGGLVSLNESKENGFLAKMLKQHIPLMDLNDAEALLTCETCLDALQGVLSFILKCLEVEEKINKYAEMEGTDDKGRIELKEVQRFICAPTVKLEIESFGGNDLEQKCVQIQKGYTATTVTAIKYEEETDMPELINKTELVGIKLEELGVETEHADINSEEF